MTRTETWVAATEHRLEEQLPRLGLDLLRVVQQRERPDAVPCKRS